MSISDLINASVSCVLCGTKGVGNCDCWVQCACGWSFEKGTACRNPSCAYRPKKPKSKAKKVKP